MSAGLGKGGGGEGGKELESILSLPFFDILHEVGSAVHN